MSNPEPTLTDVLTSLTDVLNRLDQLETQLSNRVDQLEAKLDTEVKRWDERFFQLTRDTLNFTRNGLITAAVVVVLAPLLRETAAVLVETLLAR